ncbi:MAG: hypothetical protein K6T86_12640 [Pirellulales bacterium]|nr:hypothetical protein [Pirellulales bacterium]
MTSVLGTVGRAPTSDTPDRLAPWHRPACWAVWMLPLLIALLLAMRRLQAALQAGPSLFAVLSLAGLGIAGTLASLMLIDPRPGQPYARRTGTGLLTTCLLALTPLASMALMAWAVWLPRSAVWVPSLLLASVLGQAALLYSGMRRWHVHRLARAGASTQSVQHRAADEPAGNGGPLVLPAKVRHIEQHLVRGFDAAGHELVAGTLRLVFQPGSQHAVAHVAFCPPLTGKPQVLCRRVSGPEARLKVTQAVPFGARLEARLPRPTSETVVLLVEFTATAVQGGGETAQHAPAPTRAASEADTETALRPVLEGAGQGTALRRT